MLANTKFQENPVSRKAPVIDTMPQGMAEYDASYVQSNRQMADVAGHADYAASDAPSFLRLILRAGEVLINIFNMLGVRLVNIRHFGVANF
jgi:hypothetical protein